MSINARYIPHIKVGERFVCPACDYAILKQELESVVSRDGVVCPHCAGEKLHNFIPVVDKGDLPHE